MYYLGNYLQELMRTSCPQNALLTRRLGGQIAPSDHFFCSVSCATAEFLLKIHLFHVFSWVLPKDHTFPPII